jgi:hypothetical protein
MVDTVSGFWNSPCAMDHINSLEDLFRYLQPQPEPPTEEAETEGDYMIGYLSGIRALATHLLAVLDE